MNDAHLHLLINHIPVLGTIFSTLLFLAAILLNSNDLKMSAFFGFILSGIMIFPTYSSGEGAEDILKKMVGTSLFHIHEHEEIAEFASIMGYSLVILAGIGLYLHIRKHAQSGKMNVLILIWAIVVSAALGYAGYTGGQIRHIEARGNFISPSE